MEEWGKISLEVAYFGEETRLHFLPKYMKGVNEIKFEKQNIEQL